MTSYTDIFTGNPVQASPTGYRAFTIAANTELSWPLQNEDSSNVAADVMEVTASAASLSLTLPAANQVGTGKSVLVRNVGANTFTVKGNEGATIQSITAGQVFWIYVTDNSTVAGTWSSFQYGTGTSSADAATLAGYGLVAVSSTLNLSFPFSAFNSSDTLTTGYRATVANWTGGAGTFAFSACVTLDDGWFVLVKNSGSGALTLNPNASETIDGVSTINLNPGESCIVACDGTSLYTIGRNSATTAATFTRLVKSVAGSSNVTLTSAEAAYDIQEYTGAITASISVIVPTSVGRWWIYNNTSGAFSLTVKTAAGTGVVIAQGTRQIAHCDGTNVVLSVDAGTGTVTSIGTGTGLSGGPITTSGTVSLANTAVAAGTYGGALGVHSSTVDAQGRLTAASFTARSVTGTSNRITVTNGDGVSGAPTVDISSAYVGQNTITTLGTITTGVWNGTAITSLGTVTTGVWNGTDIAVADGGTGVSTLTAYAPIFGGTTGTGAVQSGTVGTAGQILTSNGAGALPTFQAATGIAPTATTAQTTSDPVTITVDFTTYSSYRLIYNGVTANNLGIEASSDGGSGYTAFTITGQKIVTTTISSTTSIGTCSTGNLVFDICQPVTGGEVNVNIHGVTNTSTVTSVNIEGKSGLSAACNRIKLTASGGSISAGYYTIVPTGKR